jgi:protein SCO1
MIRFFAPIMLLLSVLAASGVTAAAHEAKPTPTGTDAIGITTHPHLSIIRPAPDFILVDNADRRFALSRLRGRVVLLSFIYTSCVTTCPLLMQSMALLKDQLKRSRLWAPSVSFVSITVDPEHDTAATLTDYAKRLEAMDANWWLLREQSAQLQPVLAAYDEWTKRLPDGDIDHPARVYLIDRRGNIREVYALSFFDERQVLADIRSLLAESKEAPLLHPASRNVDRSTQSSP